MSEKSPLVTGGIIPHRQNQSDRIIVKQKNDLEACTNLLLEARSHAVLTQNLGLVRRIDRQMEGMGIPCE